MDDLGDLDDLDDLDIGGGEQAAAAPPGAEPGAEAAGAAEPGAAPSTSDSKAEDLGAGGAEAAELPSECVKVAVRVRPLSSKEHAEGSAACVRFPQPNQIVIGKDRTFTFDSVFAPEVRPLSLPLAVPPPCARRR